MKLAFKKKPAHKPFKMASAFTILFFIILVAIFVSWIMHWAGVTYTTQSGKEAIKPIGIIDLFYVPVLGFTNRAGIIIFILMIGSFIYLSIASKAPHALSQRIAAKLKGKEFWLIPILMMFFGILGSVEGFCEESLGFYFISIPLMLIAGFDVFTGFLIVLAGAAAGVMGSTVNPFVVSVAITAFAKQVPHSVATQISSGNGLVFRFIAWFAIMAVTISFVVWYALRVKKSNRNSVTFATYEADYKYFVSIQAEEIPLTGRLKATLIVMGLCLTAMVFYLVNWDQILGINVFKPGGQWINDHIPYLTKLIPGAGHGSLAQTSTIFLIGAVVIGLINWKGEPHFIKEFMTGASDILSVCLIIALASGLAVVLNKSGMQQYLVSGLKSGIQNLSYLPRLLILFFAFLPLSFLIPSTSGFATAIFGIIGPALGVSQFSGGLAAFSWANGLLNFFTPTSGVVMGALAIGRIDYKTFLKGIWPLLLMLLLLSVVLLCLGSLFGAGSKIF